MVYPAIGVYKEMGMINYVIKLANQLPGDWSGMGGAEPGPEVFGGLPLSTLQICPGPRSSAVPGPADQGRKKSLPRRKRGFIYG